jgi:hypothetical protein
MRKDVWRVDGRGADAVLGRVVWAPAKSIWNSTMYAGRSCSLPRIFHGAGWPYSRRSAIPLSCLVIRSGCTGGSYTGLSSAQRLSSVCSSGLAFWWGWWAHSGYSEFMTFGTGRNESPNATISSHIAVVCGSMPCGSCTARFGSRIPRDSQLSLNLRLILGSAGFTSTHARASIREDSVLSST